MNLGLQRRTDLALLALRALWASGGKMSGAALAGAIGTTATFLAQVMAPLIARGWVASERGPGGGYVITDASARISLLDVIETTEGPTAEETCVLRDSSCPGEEPCAAHPVWTAARAVLVDGFEQISVFPTQGANE